MKFKNNEGFTLVEAMIAVLILTVMMLASTIALVDIKDKGVENVIRQEAVKLGQELVNDARNQQYSALPVGTINQNITRHASGFDVNFAVQRTINDVVLNTAKSVVYTISWTSTAKAGWSATDGVSGKTYMARTLVGRR